MLAVVDTIYMGLLYYDARACVCMETGQHYSVDTDLFFPIAYADAYLLDADTCIRRLNPLTAGAAYIWIFIFY